MKSVVKVLAIVIVLFNSLFAMGSTGEAAAAAKSVKWGKVTVTQEVIGKVTLLGDTSSYTTAKGKRVTKSKLKKGSEYPVIKSVKSGSTYNYYINKTEYVLSGKTIKYEVVPKNIKDQLTASTDKPAEDQPFKLTLCQLYTEKQLIDIFKVQPTSVTMNGVFKIMEFKMKRNGLPVTYKVTLEPQHLSTKDPFVLKTVGVVYDLGIYKNEAEQLKWMNFFNKKLQKSFRFVVKDLTADDFVFRQNGQTYPNYLEKSYGFTLDGSSQNASVIQLMVYKPDDSNQAFATISYHNHIFQQDDVEIH